MNSVRGVNPLCELQILQTPWADCSGSSDHETGIPQAGAVSYSPLGPRGLTWAWPNVNVLATELTQREENRQAWAVRKQYCGSRLLEFPQHQTTLWRNYIPLPGKYK